MKMVNLIVDFVVVIVGINEVNIWFIILFEEMENIKKFEFIVNNIDLIGIDIIGIFCLLRRIFWIFKIEIIIENVKYLIGFILGMCNLREI